MVELGWVLLGLGAVLVIGVYLWGRGFFRRSELARISRRRRTEPHISSEPEFFADDVQEVSPLEQPLEQLSETEEPELSAPPAEPAARRPPEKVVTIRFIPKSAELSSEKAVLALREAGFRHGRYGIFHLHEDSSAQDARFSVASLTEPGSFDLTNLADNSISGMSFFMVLPGPGDPVVNFDAMVQAARTLARQLDAELYDDRGSSWSIQRERYVREEIIEYRHQLSQH